VGVRAIIAFSLFRNHLNIVWLNISSVSVFPPCTFGFRAYMPCIVRILGVSLRCLAVIQFIG